MAVMMQESSCEKGAVNGDSIGLMQINTGFTRADNKGAIGWCSDYGLSQNKDKCKKQLLDPSVNLNVGTRILKSHFDTFGEDKNTYENKVKSKCKVENLQKKYLSYNNKWEMALRAYNGFGCGVSGADNNYVENVGKKYVNLVLEYNNLKRETTLV